MVRPLQITQDVKTQFPGLLDDAPTVRLKLRGTPTTSDSQQSQCALWAPSSVADLKRTRSDFATTVRVKLWGTTAPLPGDIANEPGCGTLVGRQPQPRETFATGGHSPHSYRQRPSSLAALTSGTSALPRLPVKKQGKKQTPADDIRTLRRQLAQLQKQLSGMVANQTVARHGALQKEMSTATAAFPKRTMSAGGSGSGKRSRKRPSAAASYAAHMEAAERRNAYQLAYVGAARASLMASRADLENAVSRGAGVAGACPSLALDGSSSCDTSTAKASLAAESSAAEAKVVDDDDAWMSAWMSDDELDEFEVSGF